MDLGVVFFFLIPLKGWIEFMVKINNLVQCKAVRWKEKMLFFCLPTLELRKKKHMFGILKSTVIVDVFIRVV